MKPKRTTRSTPDALRQTLLTLSLVIGSVLPFAIAFLLVASTNEDNPLDNIPSYEDPPTETLTVPLDGADPVISAFRYRGRVRLFIEGAGRIEGLSVDAFYQYAEDGSTPPVLRPGLAINGQPALDALASADSPPAYEADHLYGVIYEVGASLRPMSLRYEADQAAEVGGALTVTLVQLTD